MFSKFYILASVITGMICLFSRASCQTNYLPDIPCPNVFQYSHSSSKTIGIITVSGFKHGRTKLLVELSQAGAYNLAYFGKLSLNFSKHKVFEYIDEGRALTFKVEFPFDNLIPRVTSIEVNGIQICAGPKYGLPSTRVKLEYTLMTFPSGSTSSKYDTNPSRRNYNWQPNLNQDPESSGLNPSFSDQSSNRTPFLNWPSLNQSTLHDPPSNQPIYSEGATEISENPDSLLLDIFNEYRPADDYGPKNVHPTFVRDEGGHMNQEPTTGMTIHESALFNSSTNRATLEYIDSVCGQENPNYDIIKLNVKGTVIHKSRFPWISAIFKRVKADYTFQCGGSLISTRTVVSAAHCFYLGFEAIKPEDILISMGLHELTRWLDAKNIGVEKIIQHPDYNPRLLNFDADLAVVRLKQRLTFTTSIRPICMWQGSLDTSEIEGASGAIVGWGADGYRNTTIVPTLVNAEVVSEITCLRSNFVFISLTSSRTLCAGNLDGSGPCMGDSGNGLMIKKRNKWMIRGTVSAALGNRDRQCILDQYVIYSDIAKFSEWIHSNMLL